MIIRQYNLTLTTYKKVANWMKTCMRHLYTQLPGPLGSHSQKFLLLRFSNSNLSKLDQYLRNSKRWNHLRMTVTLVKINQMKAANILKHRNHPRNPIIFHIRQIRMDNGE